MKHTGFGELSVTTFGMHAGQFGLAIVALVGSIDPALAKADELVTRALALHVDGKAADAFAFRINFSDGRLPELEKSVRAAQWQHCLGLCG